MTQYSISANEAWPVLVVEDSWNEGSSDVAAIPKKLAERFWAAEARLDAASTAILDHLRSTGQGSEFVRRAFGLDTHASD